MLEKVEVSSDVRFTVEVMPIDELFSPEDEISIYRIVQECVNNILKHSHATEARVIVNRNGQDVQINVSDNGEGFNLNERTHGRRGFGLTGLAERAKMLGGTVSVQSTPGKGTTISVRIDAPRKKDGEKGRKGVGEKGNKQHE
jgi:signal transduction histidine kinase